MEAAYVGVLLWVCFSTGKFCMTKSDRENVAYTVFCDFHHAVWEIEVNVSEKPAAILSNLYLKLADFSKWFILICWTVRRHIPNTLLPFEFFGKVPATYFSLYCHSAIAHYTELLKAP